jgi:hypothetical protein
MKWPKDMHRNPTHPAVEQITDHGPDTAFIRLKVFGDGRIALWREGPCGFKISKRSLRSSRCPD